MASKDASAVKRKGSFSFKFSPAYEGKKAKEGEGTVKSRDEKSSGLVDYEHATPKKASSLGLSPRDSGKKSTKAGTTTSTTSTTTTTTSTASALTTTTSSAHDLEREDTETSRDPRVPRSHWLHYDPSNEPDTRKAIGKRGASRRQQLDAIRDSLLDPEIRNDFAPPQLFRQNAKKPALWLKEYCMVAAPVWKGVMQDLAAANKLPDLQAAIADPGKYPEQLQAVFSNILKNWATKGQEGFATSIPLAMKAMGAELRHQFNVCMANKPAKEPDEAFKAVLADLLVFSLAENPDAPKPLTKMFCNYLAGFLGAEPTHLPSSGLQLKDLAGRINAWRPALVMEHFDFNPLEDLRQAADEAVLQKFKLLPKSDAFNQFAEKLTKAMESIDTFRMNSTFTDHRLAKIMQREFDGKVSKWYEINSEGKRVEITRDADAMHRLFNVYPPQGLRAQACCSQEFYQSALNLIIRDRDLRPFADAGKRSVLPDYSQYIPEWTIKRLVDGTLEIDCHLLTYFEQATVLVPDDSSTVPEVMSKTRAILPGNFSMHIKVTVSPSCAIKMEEFACSAYNLKYLEGMPEKVAQEVKPDEDSQSDSRSTLKSLKRLSQRFAAPLNFGKEDETPGSPRSGNADKPGKPGAKEKQ